MIIQKSIVSSHSQYNYKLLNSLQPGYINNLFKEEISQRSLGQNIEDNYIELKEEFAGLFNSEIFRIGSGRFISMLKKKN